MTALGVKKSSTYLVDDVVAVMATSLVMYTSYVYIIAHLHLMSSPFDLTRASWHPSHVVRGYPLTTSPPLPTMTKRHVAHQKDEGGKPHFYKTTGKSGCRVYVGRKYLGYFASMQAAHEALDKSKPIEKATVVEKAAEQKVYKYVLTRQTQKGANVPRSLLDQDQGRETDAVDQEILSSGQVPEGGS